MIGERGLCPIKGSDIHHVASKQLSTTGQITDTLQPEKFIIAIEAQHKLPLHPVMGDEAAQVLGGKLHTLPIDAAYRDGPGRPLIVVQVSLCGEV